VLASLLDRSLIGSIVSLVDSALHSSREGSLYRWLNGQAVRLVIIWDTGSDASSPEAFVHGFARKSAARLARSVDLAPESLLENSAR